jgi:hypothetical protein
MKVKILLSEGRINVMQCAECSPCALEKAFSGMQARMAVLERVHTSKLEMQFPLALASGMRWDG